MNRMEQKAKQHRITEEVRGVKRSRMNGFQSAASLSALILALILQLSIMGTTEAFVATKPQMESLCRIEVQAEGSEPDQSPLSPELSRRSALMSAAKSASAALMALSIDPSTALAADKTVTPITASWKSVDGLNTMEEDQKNFVGFDGKSYQAMISDQERTPKFYKAMEERIVDGQTTVLDLGTGPFAIFAIRAAELGAKKVYAIEANKEAARVAQETVDKKGYGDIITVLEGFSADIELPEKVDLIVAEIIGSIVSEEGVVATIADAHKRFAKNPTSPKSWIPTRVQTFASPASYTLHNMFGPPGFDWNKLNGEPVRFSCRDLGLQLLSDPQLVEDVVFADILNYGGKGTNGKNKQFTFTVDETRTKDNTQALIGELQKNQLGKSEATRMAIATGNSFTGVAFWPRLTLSEDESITITARAFPDGGHQRSHWQTVLPIMKDSPVPVQGGDVIKVTTNFDVPSGGSKTDILTPASYKVDGTVTSSVETTLA